MLNADITINENVFFVSLSKINLLLIHHYFDFCFLPFLFFLFLMHACIHSCSCWYTYVNIHIELPNKLFRMSVPICICVYIILKFKYVILDTPQLFLDISSRAGHVACVITGPN